LLIGDDNEKWGWDANAEADLGAAAVVGAGAAQPPVLLVLVEEGEMKRWGVVVVLLLMLGLGGLRWWCWCMVNNIHHIDVDKQKEAMIYPIFLMLMRPMTSPDTSLQLSILLLHHEEDASFLFLLSC
jgi:hypothetical protein